MRADISGSGPLRAYRFWVVDSKTAFKLEHTLLTPVSLALRDSVVQRGLWAKTHGDESREAPGKTWERHTLSLRMPDRVGLLRDLALTLLAHNLDFDSLVAYNAVGTGGEDESMNGNGDHGMMNGLRSSYGDG